MNKISVVIPIFNAESTISRCLDSLQNQTLKEIEIICIDDKSNDTTSSILRHYEAKDNRIRIITFEKNYGCNVARNTGIQNCNGEYIGFVDADDFISENYFEELYKTAKAHNSDICATDQVVIYNSSNYKNTGINIASTIIKNIPEKGNIITASGITWNKIYKRDFIIKNGIKFYETKIAGGDNYFTAMAVILANSIAINHTAEYYYVQLTNSIVHRPKDKKSFEIIKLYETIEQNIKNNRNLSPEEKKEWLKIIQIRERRDFETFKQAMSQKYVKKFKRLINRKINKISFLEKIFSIKNSTTDNFHKVIRILGLEIKYRSKSRIIKRMSHIIERMNYEKEFLKIHGINKEKISSYISNFNSYGITQDKRKTKIIVSLTSYPERMYDLHYCIYSLLTQETKPDEVILWLAKEQFPNREKDIPKQVLDLIKNGLSIKFCEDIKSYKKLIPALREYPNDIIVTADDDIFYDYNWLEKLYNEYEGDCVIAHRCHRIIIENEKILPYRNWEKCVIKNNPSFLNFATGAGGIMYPPHCLHKEVANEALFKKLAPKADDVWFWAMSVLNNTKIKTVTEPNRELKYVNPERELGFNEDGTLCATNKFENDLQISNVIEYLNIQP
ncbi:glycosyltransferase [bacterium]|nr:glycosyltransferase [bacterium]